MQKEHDKSENDIKSLQSVGQIVGEVLKQLTEEKFIVKATNGPRYVVGCRRSINKELLKQVQLLTMSLLTVVFIGHSRGIGHDNAYHYASFASRSRSVGL